MGEATLPPWPMPTHAFGSTSAEFSMLTPLTRQILAVTPMGEPEYRLCQGFEDENEQRILTTVTEVEDCWGRAVEFPILYLCVFSSLHRPVHDDTASGSPAMPPPKRPARTPSKPPPSAASVRSRAVTINDEKPTDQRSVGAGAKNSQHERVSRRASSTHTLRIEHATHPTLEIDVSSVADKPSYLVPTLKKHTGIA